MSDSEFQCTDLMVVTDYIDAPTDVMCPALDSELVSEMPVYAGYIRCIRCGLMIFLDTELAKVDGVTCPDCGVTNLLGDLYGLRKKDRIVVARSNGSVG